MAPPDYISNYWGKAQPSIDGGADWHPVAYHCLDVAAAGEALLNARPQLLSALAHASGLPEIQARQWLLFGLALHDVGKFADCFQCKVEPLWHHRSVRQQPPSADPGHGRVGLAMWSNGCEINTSSARSFDHLFGPPSRLSASQQLAFTTWFAAISGHHGRPVEAHDLNGRICDAARADAFAFIESAAKLFDPRVPTGSERLSEQRMRSSSWLVAGLAMLADWIGSNQAWFEYTEPEQSLEGYWEVAQGRAKDALANSGLSTPRIARSYSLAEALPGVKSPASTPLQKWAANEAVIAGQSLVVIEDLTGAGKTEAALILAHRLCRQGAAEGLYWALPTMATADALYRRLADSYRNLFENPTDTSLVLAHSSREFNDIFQKSIRLESAGPELAYFNSARMPDDADVTATAACSRWIADDRRKTFLADVGVGTIDQAVLGILPSKHQAMRLAALCRRVLVIDEIHSLDAYQNSLVESLLEFHAALGGSAILISATLTLAARQRLANAFAKGATWPAPKLTEPHFPLATIVDGSGHREHRLDAGRGTRRDLPVQRLADTNAAVVVLTQASHDGLAAVWIRNTVQDALDAYREVKALLPDAQVDLFHARFALGDRLEIEQRVLHSFGKVSSGVQRQRILIATQVVEQSLDCDWDVMISDLAPIDLLIQRAGRLHRHDRGARPSPVLHIVGPEPVSDAGAKWYEAAFPRGAFVYPHHGRLWLTMKSLLESGGLNLASGSPRDLIERVYADVTEIPPDLHTPSGKAEGKAASERGIGRMNALDRSKGYVHQAGAWESDTRTPTRLGDPTRTLRLAKWDGQRLMPWFRFENNDRRKAWRLSEVSVLAARVKDVIVTDPALRRAVDAEIETWPDRYDPPLLVPLVESGGEWRANLRNERDEKLTIVYCQVMGLRFLVP